MIQSYMYQSKEHIYSYKTYIGIFTAALFIISKNGSIKKKTLSTNEWIWNLKKKKKSNTKIKNKIAVMVGEEKLYLKYCRISSRRQEGNLSC